MPVDVKIANTRELLQVSAQQISQSPTESGRATNSAAHGTQECRPPSRQISRI